MIRATSPLRGLVGGLLGLAVVAWASAASAGGGKAGKAGKVNSDLPVVDPGGTCESAVKAYVDEIDLKKKKGEPPDLNAQDYGQVLNDGAYLSPCSVPDDMSLDICVAVLNGEAVGVTVKSSPSNDEVIGCVAEQVRTLSFPSRPRLDVAKTKFAPAPPPHHEQASSSGGEPETAPPPPRVPPSSGCGCGSTPQGGRAALAMALLLGAALGLRRARPSDAR